MQRYSVLAPTVLEGTYDATVAALDAESKVNGFWNTIIAHYFQANDFNHSIDPEAQVIGGFVDLLVSRRVVPGNPGPATYEHRVLFEGKGADGDSFLNIQSQLSNYFMDNYKRSGEKLWAIGARGSNVCFWRWDVKEKGGAKLQKVIFRNGGDEVYEPITPTSTPTVLSVATNQTEIRRFLLHMFATQ